MTKLACVLLRNTVRPILHDRFLSEGVDRFRTVDFTFYLRVSMTIYNTLITVLRHTPNSSAMHTSVTEYYMNMGHMVDNDYGGYRASLTTRFYSLVVECWLLKQVTRVEFPPPTLFETSFIA